VKKIPTVFRRDPEDMKRVLPEVSPGCEWVLDGEGVATRKYDGTCVRLDEDGKWLARREVRPGKRTLSASSGRLGPFGFRPEGGFIMASGQARLAGRFPPGTEVTLVEVGSAAARALRVAVRSIGRRSVMTGW
jgi:hypothetical protein